MTATSHDPRCYVALELSQAKWLVGALLPGRAKIILHTVRGGDAAGLVEVLDRVSARASNEVGTQVPLSVCYEIGYDGFWLARYLIDRGIDMHVLDSSSFRVSRRGRRAKTDRIDVEAMAVTLRAFMAGDIWRPAPGQPSPRSAGRPRSAAPARAPGPQRPRKPGRRIWADAPPAP